jgi:ABC-type iron transport system FetAB ATPase subunit
MQYEKFSEKINTETYVKKSIEKRVLDGWGTIILIGPSGCGKSAIGTSLSILLSSQHVFHYQWATYCEVQLKMRKVIHILERMN